MTINLSYNDDLSRVQIAVTDLPDVDTVTIERSLNGILWTTVRGGQALPVTGGAASLDDYEFAADVENQYRVRTGLDAGLYLPGTAGSYASTPNHASLQITGDYDLRVDAHLTSWASGAIQALIGRYDTAGNQRSYLFMSNATGNARSSRSTNGTTAVSANSSVSVGGSAGRLATRNTYTAATGMLRFYTASSMAGSWTQLGTDMSTTAGAVHAGTAPMEIGSRSLGTGDVAAGVVYAAEARSGIGGTPVANPDFTIHPTDTTSFVDAAGRTWTVHGDARIIADPIYTGSITPSLGGKAWLKSIRHPFLNRPVYKVLALSGQEIGRASRGSDVEVQGRSVPVAISDVRGSREFTITVQVEDEQAAAEMDLILASGDVFFLQVPPELAPHMTGGYVRIGGTGQGRPADTVRWRFTLPCRVVAPPGPGVVGTTLTWRTVLRLYGSWEALLATHPTWADLLQTVGSPEDAVVLP